MNTTLGNMYMCISKYRTQTNLDRHVLHMYSTMRFCFLDTTDDVRAYSIARQH